jgi:hypothetical protein
MFINEDGNNDDDEEEEEEEEECWRIGGTVALAADAVAPPEPGVTGAAGPTGIGTGAEATIDHGR